jgi:hypothetical protein
VQASFRMIERELDQMFAVLQAMKPTAFPR